MCRTAPVPPDPVPEPQAASDVAAVTSRDSMTADRTRRAGIRISRSPHTATALEGSAPSTPGAIQAANDAAKWVYRTRPAARRPGMVNIQSMRIALNHVNPVQQTVSGDLRHSVITLIILTILITLFILFIRLTVRTRTRLA